jgi:hypothetical protein
LSGITGAPGLDRQGSLAYGGRLIAGARASLGFRIRLLQRLSQLQPHELRDNHGDIGFLISLEKFCTPDDFSLLNKHL